MIFEMGVKLYDYQLEALSKMKNGCILNGGVGSGKSRTGIAYYYICQGGQLDPFKKMKPGHQDLYIITTARKRDTNEWNNDLAPFRLSTNNDISQGKVFVDSWNNIKKYEKVEGAFFIFDEQRVVGKGQWVKTFLKLTKKNNWILLSATPGDTWTDYIPVFIANGFYKNRTEFNDRHVMFSRFSKYPKVERYFDTGRLIRLRNSILIDMKFERPTISHHEDVIVNYDILDYKTLVKTRFNYETNEPYKNAGELCYGLRKIVNKDISRSDKVLEIFNEKGKVIVFYNFDYELDILKNLEYGPDVKVAEWNGHKHQPIPESERWVYLVQYNAGSEGWNCIKTDTIIFYSQNYSYRTLVQAAGRIDRLNTPYKDLYFYHLKSRASIDLAISRALKSKKEFNAVRFVNNWR